MGGKGGKGKGEDGEGRMGVGVVWGRCKRGTWGGNVGKEAWGKWGVN